MSTGSETLRLEFGTASTAIGTQWAKLQQANGHANAVDASNASDSSARVLAFEAKGRIRRRTMSRPKPNDADEASNWSGNVEVYDQSEGEVMDDTESSGRWDWSLFTADNLFEIDEFRSHLPLHNYYEGTLSSSGGNISVDTMDAIEDRLRTILEESDSIRCIQTMVDATSSFGGLAQEVLTYLSDEVRNAVKLSILNDYEYPLSDSYSHDEVRDMGKLHARRNINFASSFVNVSHLSDVVFPIGMYTSPGVRHAQENLYSQSSSVATALGIALSTYSNKRFEYGIVDGMASSFNVLDLSAAFPKTHTDRLALFGTKDDSLHQWPDVARQWQDHSLLPAASSDTITKLYGRQVRLRGAFSDVSTVFQDTMETMSSADSIYQWSTHPFYLSNASESQGVDGMSQLALSTRVGTFLSEYATSMQGKMEARVRYEYIRNGMSPDDLEELHAALKAQSDQYQS